jgi:1,2-diacylglycerol 3-beta-galactosyltransferase
MSQRKLEKPHMLFLFSDTGGGHRSATEAIIEALNLEFPNQISCEMVDVFREYAPPPLEHAPALYPHLARLTDVWKLGYHLSNGHRRTRAFSLLAWPYVLRSTRRMVREHPCDLMVSVHPLSNGPVLRALGTRRPPFVTVVTDMVSTHAFWYHHRADMVIVPTETARRRAVECGLAPGQVQVAGLPVADRFCQPAADRGSIRRRLGWKQDRPVVLLVGGGEGMGPLEQIAAAVNDSGLRLSLAVVTGRNTALRQRLEEYPWSIPAHVYGFVREMPDFMRAADVLVTKAGPGTISEGFIAGLPLILYSRVPGQEDGNVSYVVNEGAGIWAPEPQQVVDTLKHWLLHPERCQRAASASRQLARPEAARQIANLLVPLLASSRGFGRFLPAGIAPADSNLVL